MITAKLTRTQELYLDLRDIWETTFSGRTSEGRSILVKLRSNEQMPAGIKVTIEPKS